MSSFLTTAAESDVEYAPVANGDRRSALEKLGKSVTDSGSWISYMVPRMLAIPFFTLLFVWLYNVQGGVGLTTEGIFGMHALFMSLFIIIFSQEAIMVYHVPNQIRNEASRKVSRLLHLAFHLCSLGCLIGGLVSIFVFTQKQWDDGNFLFPYVTLYSVHSWVGLVMVALWAFQFFGGFYVHVVSASKELKNNTRKYHSYFGNLVYVVGIATIMLAFQDIQSADMSGMFSTQTLLANVSAAYGPNSYETNLSSGAAFLVGCIAISVFVAQFLNSKRTFKTRENLNSLFYWAPRGFAAIFFILLLVWLVQAHGGLNTDSGLWSLHAFFMSVFVLVCIQEPVLRTFSVSSDANEKGLMTENDQNRAIHVAYHFVGLGFALGGLIAVLQASDRNFNGNAMQTELVQFPYLTMYSPHSWCAIIFLFLWATQMCAEIYVFAISNSPAVKESSKPYLTFLSRLTYGAGMIVCAMGLQDMQITDLASAQIDADTLESLGLSYTALPHSLISNLPAAGAVVLVFGAASTFFVFV